ncbi:MAG: M48 family peptidase, partial [Nitrospirae bacterium]
MKDKAKEDFKEMVFRWAEKIQVPVTSISFRRMKTKWASFST